MKRIGVLISGGGTNLQALIDAVHLGPCDAEIAIVISNRHRAFGLERAQKAGIQTAHIGHRKYDTREAYDEAIVHCLRQHDVNWVCLAGFMRIITPVFLDAYQGRILNIHPSLLPAFPGLHAQQQAYDAGVRVTGATVHFVDRGCDTGPIIAQGSVPVVDGDTVDTLKQRILSIEHRLYPMVVHWAIEGRLSLRDGAAYTSILPRTSPVPNV